MSVDNWGANHGQQPPSSSSPVQPQVYQPAGYAPVGYGSHGAQPPSHPGPGYPQPPSRPGPGYPQPSVHPGYGYPAYPSYPAMPGRPPRGFTLPLPVAFHAIPGTPFGVAVVGVAPTVSGWASGSLAAGVGSIVVAVVVGLFALLGADPGWGPMVAGAFAILGVLIAAAAAGLSRGGFRQIRRAGGSVTGRGLAVAGLICGMTGLAATAVAFVAGVLATGS